MLPVLTFAAGLIVGAAGYRALKKSKSSVNLRAAGDAARDGLGKAQSGLRQAAVSGLSAVERSSANLRVKLETVPVEAEEPADEPVSAAAAAPQAAP
nr:hypothetical protein [Azospirillaceae bacterium]